MKEYNIQAKKQISSIMTLDPKCAIFLNLYYLNMGKKFFKNYFLIYLEIIFENIFLKILLAIF